MEGRKNCIVRSFDDVEVMMYPKENSTYCLVQMVGPHDVQMIEEEMSLIQEMAGDRSFSFVAIYVKDSNKALSPWNAPAVFSRQEDFGDGARQTLRLVLDQILPEVKKILELPEDVRYILGGYSFAGLFALWAGYETDQFYGIAAASPSVWFPQWDEYIEDQVMLAKKVYVSLGRKESKTRNRQMAQVTERIQLQYERLAGQIGEECCKLEWNPGNHFTEIERRKAKAFAWVME